MNGDDKPDPGEEPRTIFNPGAGGPLVPPESPPPAAPDAPSPGWGDEPGAPPHEVTNPGTAPASDWGSPAPSPPPPPPPPPPPQASPEPPPAAARPSGERTFMPGPLRTDAVSIKVGDVLNHIFEVRRFIARGGMGEVFEGVNISSDEPVAIKVMLPALAADPSVQAMFRREAKTLTKLAHPALVQYRVLAQEPQLGILYIVTDFIAGTNLADVLGQLKVGAEELRGLARRLASGLKAAHALGAVHRDISPDNVLLEDGRLDQAKIIDFGIAKDLTASSKTIVGDGFAGKLNYVAPEQLGDFGREVGAWSDVYSLGLVLLSVAQGRGVDMGATLVDAVDKRRAGPDLSAVPDAMRGVIAAMLVADPAHRLRSMDAVLDALDHGVGPPIAPSPPPPPPPPPPKPGGNRQQMMLLGGGVIALLLIALAVWLALSMGSGKKDAATPIADATPSPTAPSPSAAAAATAPETIDAVLPGIGCSWLNIGAVKTDASGADIAMLGAARDPASAQGTIARALSDAKIAARSIDFEAVATAPAEVCTPLDALRPFRDPDSRLLTVERPKFELSKNAEGALAADALITIDRGGATGEVAILGIEPSGDIQIAADSRAALDAMAAANPDRFTREGDRYRAELATSHEGLSGVLRLRSDRALSGADRTLLMMAPGKRGASWASDIGAAARRGNWKIDMIWYRTVDEIPG